MPLADELDFESFLRLPRFGLKRPFGPRCSYESKVPLKSFRLMTWFIAALLEGPMIYLGDLTVVFKVVVWCNFYVL